MTFRGEKDEPIKGFREDALSIESQVSGFAEFIMTCETPMTISIQGNWGSGKTSFYNAVKAWIREETARQGQEGDYVFVDFNSWQYSQFNRSDRLALDLFSSIIKLIRKDMHDDPETERLTNETENKLKQVAKWVGAGLVSAANAVISDKYGVDMKKIYADVKDSHGEIDGIAAEYRNEPDGSEIIASLRSDFQKCIMKRLKITDGAEAGNKRLIIFVDDLDRLAPDKAVELLEALKIFLDCRYCVFVLAIDYSIVVNGVSMKYKGSISADKGNDFFEKMIQVVYKLPSSIEHSEAFITRILRKHGVSSVVAPDFSLLIKNAGKDNPRAVKRMINTFLLLRRIAEKKLGREPSNDDDAALFAFICLRETSEDLYNEFVANSGELLPFLEKMTELKDWLISGENDFNCLDERELENWDLLGNGRANYKMRKFLLTFFQILVVDDRIVDLGNPDFGQSLADPITAERIRNALLLSGASGTGSYRVSDDDTVSAIIDLMNGYSCEAGDGSIRGAYTVTLDILLSNNTAEGLAQELEEYSFLSDEPSEDFPIMFSVRISGDGFGEAGKETSLYSKNASPQQLVEWLDRIAADQGRKIVWLKGRIGQTLCEMGVDDEKNENETFEPFLGEAMFDLNLDGIEGLDDPN